MCAIQAIQFGDRLEMDSQLDLHFFDHAPDPALDELTELAAVLCNADYAYVGWQDYNRLWFKSRYGFQSTDQARMSTACQLVLESGRPLLLGDAAQDMRLPPEGIPLAGARDCRSYAGVPLFASDQHVIGTLAVLAAKPGQFKTEHLTLLDVLGRQVVTRLELYRRIRLQEQAQRARLKTERALAVERCFVETTLDSIPAPVAVLDTAGRLVRMNHACEHLTGLRIDTAAGKLFVNEVMETKDRGWVTAKLHEAAAGAESGPHETSWRTGEEEIGSRRISWTLRPLAGPNREVQFLIVTGQDVTGERQIEMELHSTEARYREVVENSLGFVFTCTMEGRLTSMNSFTAETLGYRAEALISRSLSELTDEPGEIAFREMLNALGNGSEWHGTLPLRRSDGIYRHIAVRSRRMQLPGERPFVLNHGMDITEQHEAEEALRLATRQRELILESAGDGIFGIDLDGRIIFINRAGAKALGSTPEELAGEKISEDVRHGHADGTVYTAETNPIFQAMRRNEPIRMNDEIFWSKDGSAVPVEYSASPILDEGVTTGMVVAFQDVSERLRLETMKDEFISMVSHELKTPLASLRGALGLIQSGSLDKRPEKQRQLIDMAIGNSDRLTRLVNDILDFDRVSKGSLPLHREAVDAANLLRRAADVAYASAAQARIGFKIEARAAKVFADEERLLQVLNELIANAIKFSPEGTSIRLSLRLPDENATPREIRFCVEDQGRGIAANKLERIFERFQQGDASDARSRGGTGLGLALCRSIVEQHGGRMWAESEPEKGSRFFFTLPEAK